MASSDNLRSLQRLEEEISLTGGSYEKWKHLSTESTVNPTTDVEMRAGNSGDGPGSEDQHMEVDKNLKRAKEDEEERQDKERKKILMRILTDLITLARNSEGTPDYEELLPKASDLVDKAAVLCAGREYSALNHSFAHSDDRPLLVREGFESGVGNEQHELHSGLFNILSQAYKGDALTNLSREFSKAFSTERTKPWNQTPRPHPLSTPLSRFKASINTTPNPSQHPAAHTVYTARCEVADITVAPEPGWMSFPPSASIAIRVFPTGPRASALEYHLLDEWERKRGDTARLPKYKDVMGRDPGLEERVTAVAVEEARKLLFAADRERIKSWRWGRVEGERRGRGGGYKEGFPVHTFDTGDWRGPMGTLSSVGGEGSVVRAGKGSVGVWNLDSAPTHGPQGTKRIGKKYSTDDWLRDDPENIEDSYGSSVNLTVAFEDPKFKPAIMQPHPEAVGVFLCGTEWEYLRSYGFVGLDLEHGGKFKERYVGHGGQVTAISTVEGRPQEFVTACMDGFVRLWDTRMGVPALTIEVGKDEEICTAAAFANPDGIPTIFTGAGQEEHIRLWDVRARQPVYKLSTGNNAVISLGWDHKRNHLWALTEACSKEHGYKRLRHPDRDSDDEEDDDFFDEDEWDPAERWPKTAFHFEDYFGRLFDAGSSRLYRYQFKENPDSLIFPKLGTTY